MRENPSFPSTVHLGHSDDTCVTESCDRAVSMHRWSKYKTGSVCIIFIPLKQRSVFK